MYLEADRLHRSAGVTVIAVLALLGSSLTLLLGFGMIALAFISPAMSTSQFALSPVALKLLFFSISLVYIVPAIWGIFTSIGLFRLRNWARISIIVFSVILILMSGFSVLLTLFMPMPPSPGVDSASIQTFVRLAMSIFWGALVGLGIWWIVFFTRAKVKQQFVVLRVSAENELLPVAVTEQPLIEGQFAAAARERPLSLTIIAWILLVGSAFVPLDIGLHMPAVFFTKILTGWPAEVYYLCLGAIQLYVGIGLLRFKTPAVTLGITYISLMAVSSASFYLVPGAGERMRALLAVQRATFPWMGSFEQNPSFPFDGTPFLYFGAIAGLILMTVPLYFLVTRKQAFKSAATQRHLPA